MHRLSFSLAFLLLTAGCFAQVPAPFPAQDSAAQRFLATVLYGDEGQARNMFDPAIRATIPPDKFAKISSDFRALVNGFAPDRTHEFDLKDFRIDSATGAIGYMYRLRDDVSERPSIVIRVMFKDSGAVQLAGFNFAKLQAEKSPPPVPPMPPAKSSPGEEKPLEREQVWVIGGDSVRINSVAIVQFENRKAMLAIKVISAIPRDMDQEKALAMAVPIVRHAILHGYMTKALAAAKDAGRELLPDIGVAFILPGTTQGYRIQLKPEQYVE